MKLLLALLALLLIAPRALAHDFRPGVLSLDEREDGRFALVWTEPVDSNAAGDFAITPKFPPHCSVAGSTLSCGERGLDGSVAFEGLASHMRVVVAVRWCDGRSLERIVTGEEPRAVIVPARAGVGWLELGAEHVLGGLDHLAFVLGLLLLLRRTRGLLLTITAFTLAHSLTLALAVFDVVALPSAPVEATIAASVVLVAHEALHDRRTLTRRAPWAVALLFGLVHGLGFAGALREAGLARESVGWPLVWFNLGIELGQLAVVAAALVLVRAAPCLRRHRRIAAYALGVCGAFWLIERSFRIVSAS